jgi:DNA ligase-1
MDFNMLADFFEKIKNTASRLEMIDILAKLFKTIASYPNSDENLRCAVYFTQGRINSEISEDPKLGVAEKQLINLLAEKVDKKAEDIKQVVKKKGDVGIAAQELIEIALKKGIGLGSYVVSPKLEEKSSEDKSSEDKPSEGKTLEDKSSEDKPSEGKTLEDKPSEDKPSKGKVPEDKPSEDKPSECKTSELKPLEKKSTSDFGLSKHNDESKHKNNEYIEKECPIPNEKKIKKQTKKDLFGFASSQHNSENQINKRPVKDNGNHEPEKSLTVQEDTIQKLQVSNFGKGSGLTIYDVYKELDKISKISGANSTRDKSKLILGLVNKLTPIAVKYLFNIINGTLRTGASSMTIIDGLTVAFTNNKELRDQVERAYFMLPDLGQIAVLLKNGGIEGLKQLNVQIGIPIKMMLASRVPYKEIPEKLGIPFYAEYKYDGERVQVHKKGKYISLFSRHLKNISDMYPDVIEAVSNQVQIEEIVFEGEIVAMDTFYEKMLPFQVVSLRRRKYDVEEMVKKVKVTLFSFDLLYFNKTSDPKTAVMVMDFPLEDRRRYLKEIIKESEQLRISNGKYINSLEEMVEYFKKAREDGAEGIMNKSLAKDARYCPGNRGFYWIKLKGLEAGKLTDTLDVVIIGASYGQGKRAGKLSGILCAVYNPETDKFESLTNLGSGFDEPTLDMLTDRLLKIKVDKKPINVEAKDEPDIWVNPEIIIEIAGDEITVSQVATAGASINNGQGFSVRFPVFQRFREDKDVKEITTSLEVKQIYDSMVK